MPRPKNALSLQDAGNPYNPLSPSDVWEWQKQNASDAWKAAQDPQTWRDAANQYGQALLAGSVTPGMKGIRAFHGSPHDFERFSMGKIGTGEGEQVQGHGLYFSKDPAYASYWRDPKGAGQEGKLYEVNINADPKHLYDLDRPASEQSDHVREALTGSNLAKIRQTDQGFVVDYEQNGVPKTSRAFQTADAARNAAGPITAPLRDWVSGQANDGAMPQVSPDIADILRRSGIPGAKYTQHGADNYVMFDDAPISIMNKYGADAPQK